MDPGIPILDNQAILLNMANNLLAIQVINFQKVQLTRKLHENLPEKRRKMSNKPIFSKKHINKNYGIRRNQDHKIE